MHPVDEEFLRTAQVDLGNRAVGYAIAARRQRAANIKLEVGRRAGGRLNVSDLPGRIEAVLGQDGDFVGVDGGIVAIERAGNLHDAGRSEIAEAFAVIPLGLAIHVDGEDADVRSLNRKRLRRQGGIDDAGDELIDVGAGIARPYRADLDGRVYLSCDCSARHLNGFIQTEVHVDADWTATCGDYQRIVQGLGHDIGRKGTVHGLDRRRAGSGCEIPDGRRGSRSKGHLDLRIRACGNVIHVEHGLQPVVTSPVDRRRSAQQGNRVVVGVDRVDRLNGGGE